MPKANNHIEKPWYRKSGSWAWITFGLLVFTVIVTQIMADNAEKRAKENQQKPHTYKDLFTPEEAKRMGLDLKMDGSDIVKPDPNSAKSVRNFILL